MLSYLQPAKVPDPTASKLTRTRFPGRRSHPCSECTARLHATAAPAATTIRPCAQHPQEGLNDGLPGYAPYKCISRTARERHCDVAVSLSTTGAPTFRSGCVSLITSECDRRSRAISESKDRWRRKSGGGWAIENEQLRGGGCETEFMFCWKSRLVCREYH